MVEHILLFILQTTVRVPRLIAFSFIFYYLSTLFILNRIRHFELFSAWSNSSIGLYGSRATVFLGDNNMPVSFFCRRTRIYCDAAHTRNLLSKNDQQPGVCSLSNASETLKIISFALEDRKWFDFCLDILSIWLCLKTHNAVRYDT